MAKMKIRKTTLIVLSIAIALSLVAVSLFFSKSFGSIAVSSSTSKSNTGQSTSIPSIGNNVGDKATDFMVQTTDGKFIQLSSIKKPTIVYFFATWCPFCHDELTRLKSIYLQYSSKVEFLAVDLDTTEDINKIKDYAGRNGFVGDFAPGTNDILLAYQVSSTTSKYILDSNGIILAKGSGEISDSQWQDTFQKISSL